MGLFGHQSSRLDRAAASRGATIARGERKGYADGAGELHSGELHFNCRSRRSKDRILIRGAAPEAFCRLAGRYIRFI
jgi:hypothetical protein